ncbi:MAG: D-glycerate dehydrogenase [Betaproteobacteria bacterium]|nr:D-glycerate dehydrogenase [Betaproteobacteria bacterium]
MKPAILIAREVFEEVIADLERDFAVESNQADVLFTPDQLVEKLQGKQGVLTTVMDKIDDGMMARCPDLKVISNIAVGYNNIDVAAATARGIKVTNTPEVLNEATADLTWAILMAAARRVAEGDAFVRRGEWRKAFAMKRWLGADLHGATLGIIGMGRIGQAIARRALGFDMRVLYHNRARLDAATEAALRCEYSQDRDGVLKEADFLVVMVPYSAATHHFIKAGDIAKMKPSAILVNTARGGVVDDAALIAALKAGTIAGAALDVFEGEPKLNSEYSQLKNVVLTPHIGSATRSTRMAMLRLAAKNLTAALKGEAPPNWVNKT